MRRFLVAKVVAEREAERVGPWLGLVPGPWRGTAMRFAAPKAQPPLLSEDSEIAGHALALSARWPQGRIDVFLGRLGAELAPRAYGWLGQGLPPAMSGVAWYTGRLYALVAALGLFRGLRGPWGRLDRLGVLLIGDSRPEVAIAARFLARTVRHLILVCPVEHFRNRLAWQILTESGLAVVTRAETPASGWELGLDLRRYPPAFLPGTAPALYPRPLFPKPLYPPDGRAPAVESEHPVWAECHLACLVSPGSPPLPHEPTLGSVEAALSLAEQVGLAFQLA